MKKKEMVDCADCFIDRCDPWIWRLSGLSVSGYVPELIGQISWRGRSQQAGRTDA